MSLGNRSVVAATWEFGSVITQALIQFGVMAVLARLIPPEGFGLYAIVTTSLGIIALVAEIGVGQAVVQRKALTDRFLSSAFVVSIALGLLGTVVTWIASPAIAGFFKRPEVTTMIRVASTTLFINGYVNVATALLERELLFRKLAVINVVSYALGFGVVGGTLAFLKVGAWAIVAATLSQTLIRAVMLMRAAPAAAPRAAAKIDIVEILRFCAGVSLGRIFNNLASQVDYLVVGRLMGPKPLGLYQMGYQIMDLPRRFLVGVIDRVMFSAFTRIQDEQARMKAAYVQALQLANTVLVPLTVFMIIVAPEAVVLVLGDKWRDLVKPLQIMLLQVPLRASVRMGDISGTAVGRVYAIGFLKIAYASMIGVAALVGVRWGLAGVTTAVTIAVVLNLVMMVRFTMTFVRLSVPEYGQTWVPGLSLGAVVAAVALPSAWLLRTQVGAAILTLAAITVVTGLAVPLAVWIRPRTIGTAAFQVVMDFGRRFPVLSKISLALEKRRRERSEP